MNDPTFRPIANPDRLWGISALSRDELKASPRRVAVDIVRLFLANRTPVTLWGPVGARKTRTIEALAVEQDEHGIQYQVITIQPSTEDPTIIHGIMYTAPSEDTGEVVMKRSVPDVAQQVQRYYEEHGGLTILFLDEMTTCMPAQQHALLGILTHGRYGEIDISPYISIVMAANPEGTVSTVNPLGEQVINRGGHIAWYGDVTLFLEEWRSGFGNKRLSPSSDTNWYITTLLNQSMESAFRSENWTTESLVPYELMEHTERSTTELGKMVELLNEIFSKAADEVRHFYIEEVTRALLGTTWEDRMKTVTQMESQRVSADSIISKVLDLQVLSTWSSCELNDKVGMSLYHLDDQSTVMRQDQISSVASDLKELIEQGNVFHYDPYLTLWAFVMTAPNSNVKMGMHEHLVRLMNIAQKQIQAGNLAKEEAVPYFVDENTREAIRSSFRRS